MLAIIQSASLLGVEGRPVRVEVHVGKGLPTFTMVGLPDASCREARDRVRAAVASSEYEWPMRRLTINLAPSSFPKLGTSLDLAIAIGVLTATGEVPAEATEGWALVAELGLDGALRPVRGMVPLVAALRHRDQRRRPRHGRAGAPARDGVGRSSRCARHRPTPATRPR